MFSHKRDSPACAKQAIEIRSFGLKKVAGREISSALDQVAVNG
jgi:hypothetical protein